jgi:hypothetical protein
MDQFATQPLTATAANILAFLNLVQRAGHCLLSLLWQAALYLSAIAALHTY